MNLLVLKLINLASYIYLLVASFFIADFGEMASEKVYVMPAPYAFSIWLVIYVLLLTFILKSFFADEEENAIVKSIGLWFPLSMILSGTSVIVGTTPAILFLSLSLVTLCVVYTILQGQVKSSKWRIPFSMYLGWTSIATIVDAFVVIKANDIEEILSIGELGWAVIMLTLGGLIAIAFHFLQKDFIYPLVFVWGYIAVFVYQDETLIKFITAAFVLMLMVIVLVNFIRLKRSRV